MLTSVVGASALVASCNLSRRDQPPFGEIIVNVDTDVSVPRIVNRLRIDVFDERGVWRESRDYARLDPRDWPVSFSVYSDDEARDRVLVLRLRGYAEGLTRKYAGEFASQVPKVEQPYVANSREEMCAHAVELLPDVVRTGRVGRVDFLSPMTCPDFTVRFGSSGGAMAGYFDVKERGDWSFYGIGAVDVRTNCLDDSSSLTCRVNESPRLTLDPGRVWMVLRDSQASAPMDVSMVVSQKKSSPLRPPPPSDPSSPTPLSMHPVDEDLDAGRDAADPLRPGTPQLEPQPLVAIDRLVRLNIHPQVRASANVVLRGACAGTPAQLSVVDDAADWSFARTCIATDEHDAALADEPLSSMFSRATTSVSGTFGRSTTCASKHAGAACIEGGAFVFGNTEGFGPGSESALSPRIVAVSTFSLDTHEVTVADLRAALASGMSFERPADMPSTSSYCTWTPVAGDNERKPVTCISWNAARAYCQFHHGDLPTEAQWEYAATQAGREAKTRYPWGSDPPRCTCDGVADPCHAAIFGRANTAVFDFAEDIHCGTSSLPFDVDAREGAHGDVSPSGVVGLGGGVAELVLDAFHSDADPCWRAAGVVDPKCFEPEPVVCTMRGAGFGDSFFRAIASLHRSLRPWDAYRAISVGFRCAYAEPTR